MTSDKWIWNCLLSSTYGYILVTVTKLRTESPGAILAALLALFAYLFEIHHSFSDFMGGLIEHMDATTGANALDIAPNAIPANVDLIAGKEWRECWPNSEGATLPDLDSDTIANVLQ